MKISMAMVEEIKAMPDHAERVYHAALMYAREGIPVVPVAANGKALPEKSGINYQSATARPETIRSWFGEGGKFRGANIGIATGTSGGVFALDVDAGEKNGFDALEGFVKKYGEIQAPCAATPSGGLHYLFKWSDNARSSTSKIAVGIDTRGGTAEKCTGHIVAFPSVVEGRIYSWVSGGDVGDSPAWITGSLGDGWGKAADPSKIRDQVLPASQVERMLGFIDVNDLEYDDWVRVGMAIKAQDLDSEGLDLWQAWSEQGDRYRRGECGKRWKGFAGVDGPVKAGTLFFFAKRGGWKPQPGDVLPASGSNERVEEVVAEMNSKYAVVSVGGQARIIWRIDKSKMTRKQKMEDRTANYHISTRADVEMFESNNKVTLLIGDKVKEIPKVDLWLSHPARREYIGGVGCYPNGDAPDNVFNIWSGFAVEPKDVPIKRFRWHLRNIVCAGDEEVFNWLEDWIADLVQDPANPKGCSIILRGEEGCGKGVVARALSQLFGRHGIQITNSEHLFNKFNSLMEGCVFLFADEILWGGNRQNAQKLKGMVTEPTIQIEHKGVTSYSSKNMMHLMIASNEDWIIPAGPQSRRWLVLDCAPDKANNKQYFDALLAEIEDGGYEGILHHYLNREIKSNLSYAPVTRALKIQRSIEAVHHCTIAQWLVERISAGIFNTPCAKTEMGQPSEWPEFVPTTEFVSEFQEWERASRTKYNMAVNMVIQWLESVGFKRVRLRVSGEDRGNCLKVPALVDLRKKMSEVKGVYFQEDDEGVEDYDI